MKTNIVNPARQVKCLPYAMRSLFHRGEANLTGVAKYHFYQPVLFTIQALTLVFILSQKDKGFDYTMTENSADYVRSLREKESITKDGKQKDGREFLKELIVWQESNSQ